MLYKQTLRVTEINLNFIDHNFYLTACKNDFVDTILRLKELTRHWLGIYDEKQTTLYW